MFLVFAELLAPIAEPDVLRDMSQRYAGIVGKVMTDKSDSVPRALRETVMRTQDAMARKQANIAKPISADTKKDPQSADNKKEAQSADAKCAVVSCAKQENLRRCGGCKKVYYCSIAHQKEHWGIHKPNCKV
jgi:hypothetical protein